MLLLQMFKFLFFNCFTLIVIFQIKRLHDEIIFFTNYIGPRPEECLMRNEVVEKIKRVINNEWPNSQVKEIIKK
jgi:DNA polymerase sigma